MSIEKQIVVDQIEVTEFNTVQVRTVTRTIENGEIISSALHRHVVMPGECGPDEDPRVRSICAAIHTPEVVANYRAEQARIKAEAEAARIKAEQKAAATQAASDAEAQAQADAQKAAFESAVADAVTKALTGGR